MKNLRRKIYRTYLLWFVLMFTFGVLAGTVSQLFLIPLLLAHFAAGIYVCTRKCTQCHKAVLNNPINFFGTKVFIWTVRVPPRCTKCDANLLEQ